MHGRIKGCCSNRHTCSAAMPQARGSGAQQHQHTFLSLGVPARSFGMDRPRQLRIPSSGNGKARTTPTHRSRSVHACVSTILFHAISMLALDGEVNDLGRLWALLACCGAGAKTLCCAATQRQAVLKPGMPIATEVRRPGDVRHVRQWKSGRREATVPKDNTASKPVTQAPTEPTSPASSRPTAAVSCFPTRVS